MMVEILLAIGFLGIGGYLCYLFFIRTQDVLKADKWKEKVSSLLDHPTEFLQWSPVEKRADGTLAWEGLALVDRSLKVVHASYPGNGDRIDVIEDEPWMTFLDVVPLPRLDIAIASQHLVRCLEEKGFRDPVVGAPSHKRSKEGWEYIEFKVTSEGYGMTGIVFLCETEYRLGYYLNA